MGFAASPDYNMLPQPGEVSHWDGPKRLFTDCHLIDLASGYSTLIIAIIAFVFAWLANEGRNENTRSYLWGYFIAVNGSLTAIWIAFVFLADRRCMASGAFWLAQTYAALLLYFSVEAYQRSKGGWIGATVLSLNPLWWIINYFYLKKNGKTFLELPAPHQIPWQWLRSQLRHRKFREQCKLVYQNSHAAEFLTAYFAENVTNENDVAQLCNDIKQRAKQATAASLLLADNKELRRLFEFTAGSRLKSFDQTFQPLLGWKKHCATKAEGECNSVSPHTIKPDPAFAPVVISGAIFGVANMPGGLYAIKWLYNDKHWALSPESNMAVIMQALPARETELRAAGIL